MLFKLDEEPLTGTPRREPELTLAENLLEDTAERQKKHSEPPGAKRHAVKHLLRGSAAT